MYLLHKCWKQNINNVERQRKIVADQKKYNNTSELLLFFEIVLGAVVTQYDAELGFC